MSGLLANLRAIPQGIQALTKFTPAEHKAVAKEALRQTPGILAKGTVDFGLDALKDLVPGGNLLINLGRTLVECATVPFSIATAKAETTILDKIAMRDPLPAENVTALLAVPEAALGG